MPKPLSRAEFIALGELSKARRSLMVNMFAGTRLKFGTSGALKSGKKLVSSGKKVYSTSTKLAKGTASVSKTAAVAAPAIRKAAEQFIQDCAGVENIADVIEAITSEAVSELVSEMTPFVGVAMSGAKLGKAAKIVVEDARNLYKADYYTSGFRAGDPVAACLAVQTIIKTDLARHSVDLGRHSLATGAKIAGLFADLGTGTTAAIGMANAVAAIGLELASLGIDIKYMRAGNARLESPQALGIDIFAESPILGCYLLTCADTSSVANLFIADIGLPGWMDRVEEMKKKQMDPMLKIAKKAIKNSRLQLEGLASDKGTHMEKDFFAKIKSKVMKDLKVA